MSGILELDNLLRSMSPEIQAGEFVFCTVAGQYADYAHLNPLASFAEREGLTLVLSLESAKQGGLAFEGQFKQITLKVHSSLQAVGLTAAVANQLSAFGISANVVAAFYHDHIFVPADRATDAMKALLELSSQ